MPCPSEVLDLISRFALFRSKYTTADYNETQLRNEFLNPFFEALGWDVYNKAGISELYKDVIHEDQVKIGGVTKAPDYSFRIGGTRKFFVEAKKPFIKIKEDPAPALQIRRYGWSAKLPISVLTDFEEFAIYDCTIKPTEKDDVKKARIFYCQFTEYEENWEWISERFSKNGILHGGFDAYVEDLVKGKGGKGTATVDKDFLSSLESWREALAKNIALRNPDLSIRELNDAVTKTIDRIVFLRICEDRGIEREYQLGLIGEGKELYSHLCDLFRYADDKFNSGLFHFSTEKGWDESPDELTLSLKIDDKTLKEIISGLYYPKSQYEFSVMPADILGKVYEQFLGKVIRLTDGHQAKVEEKPEVRKAGGVHYTPTYIVEYIVKHTIGELIKDKTPKEVSLLRFLDPACGSGSFLIGAYQYLLDWHLQWYSEHLAPLIKSGISPNAKEIKDLLPSGTKQIPVKGKKSKEPEYSLPIYQISETDWKLTTDEKKRILINNIYGVDIDPQAVEVTKLSLLLKVLEGERSELIDKQLKITAERVLPSLHKNIKCGNSLIGSDILSQTTLDGEEVYKINPFDWDHEYSEIMQGGGFDAVIGNPPYVRMEMIIPIKPYLSKKFKSHAERVDLYVYFIERSHLLLKKDGHFGMIISNKFLKSNYGKNIRIFCKNNYVINHLIDLAGLPVFLGATVRTIVLLLKRQNKNNYSFEYSPPPEEKKFFEIVNGSIRIEDYIKESSIEININKLSEEGWVFTDNEGGELLTKIYQIGEKLGDYVENQIYMGIKSGLSEAFIIDAQTKDELISLNPQSSEIIFPFVNGRDIRRYFIKNSNIYLIYTYHGIDPKKYPEIIDYLKKFKNKLENRATKQQWYELQQPQFNYKTNFLEPKIIFPDIAKNPRFSLDLNGFFAGNTTYFIPRNDKYLLGLLNSKLSFFFFKHICAQLEGKNESYLRFFGQYLTNFPVKLINDSNKNDIALHTQIITHVARIIDLNNELSSARIPLEKEQLNRQIGATDREIDKLVYQLYDLTEDEIKIIEESVS